MVVGRTEWGHASRQSEHTTGSPFPLILAEQGKLMSLWYAQNSRQTSDSGKFRRQTRLGTTKTPGGRYRGWSYHFVSHQTGTSRLRTTISVSILDPHQNRAAYLRDFSNPAHAAEAACKWIDRALGTVLPVQAVGEVGTIPELPAQEK